MPRKQFLDAPGGDSITYDVVTEDGFRLCPFRDSEEAVQKNFDDIPTKKCRDDDILLNSYPKTGTNWLWEMLTMVIARTSKVTGKSKGPGMMEAMPTEMQEALPSPRILNTHVKYKYIPKEAMPKKLKTILLLRNPKDTVVSFYNHTKGIRMYEYDGKFENYLSMFVRGEVDYGSYPEYISEWQQVIRDNTDWKIHVMYYEDMKENGFKEMRKLCDYLGQDIDDDLLREIIESCQIDKMRKGKEDNMPEEAMKRHTQMVKNNFSMMRKGQVGDWRNWFTVAQNEMFDKWWADNTRDVDMFKFRYAL